MKFSLPIITLLMVALSGTEALRGLRNKAQSADKPKPALQMMNSKQLDLTEAGKENATNPPTQQPTQQIIQPARRNFLVSLKADAAKYPHSLKETLRSS